MQTQEGQGKEGGSASAGQEDVGSEFSNVEGRRMRVCPRAKTSRRGGCGMQEDGVGTYQSKL